MSDDVMMNCGGCGPYSDHCAGCADRLVARQLESVKHFIRWATDGWLEGDDVEFLGTALRIMTLVPVRQWTCCPLCAEIVCDDDCPLYTVRDEAGLWSDQKVRG